MISAELDLQRVPSGLRLGGDFDGRLLSFRCALNARGTRVTSHLVWLEGLPLSIPTNCE